MSDTATLEADLRDMKAILAGSLPNLARIAERLNHVASVIATREDLARLEGSLRLELSGPEGRLRLDIAEVRRDLEMKPSRASMWAMAISLVGLTVAAMSAAYLPLVSKALHP